MPDRDQCVQDKGELGSSRSPLFDAIAARRVPYVVTYGYRPDSPHPCIGFDKRDAFYRLTRHLLDLGHRVFGLILQPVASNDRVAARLAGVRDALAEQGLGPDRGDLRQRLPRDRRLVGGSGDGPGRPA